MATSVTEVFRRVRHLIQDGAAVRWPNEELLLWLGDAQRDLVVFKPDAGATVAAFTCAAGTRQTLPAGGVQLLDIPRNLTGTQRIVRRVERRVLDAENPGWHGDSGAEEVRWFTYDPRTPTVFYVSPPALVTSELELLYAATPATPTMDGNIGIEDIYLGALVDYICYRAFSKDSDFAQSVERAKLHYNAYYAAMTGKQLSENESLPAAGESTDAVR